jgi:membrane-associated protease RseP (regulator of RpoE activity)
MHNQPPSDDIQPAGIAEHSPELVPAQVVPENGPGPNEAAGFPPRRVALPLLLFVATCLTTFLAGVVNSGGWDMLGIATQLIFREHLLGAGLEIFGRAALEGLKYSVPVMTILICHEAGHFLQAWRYGVPASFPFFIPVPLPPLGTMGAVIAMDAHQGDRRAMFDIGISGPLAGLVPTMIFLVIGLNWSHVAAIPAGARGIFGDPLLLQGLARWKLGALPPGHDVAMHPTLFAGWVGLLITSVNLFPIGQLDGGHILYGLLRRKANPIATLVLLGAIATVMVGLFLGHRQLQVWLLMLFLLVMMGPRHPPTANDNVPLGIGRHILGWLTLAFLVLGFTPYPFVSM